MARDKRPPVPPGCEIDVVEGNGAILVTVNGGVDERFAGFGKLDGGKSIVIYLAKMARMTSFGIRQWSAALAALPASSAIYLLGCPTFFVDQLNMILNFSRAARVLTVLAPYQCPSCAAHSSETIDVLAQRALLAAGGVPEKTCSVCDSGLEFDETPESYFQFVSQYAAKTIDARAAELLEARGLYRAPASPGARPPRIIKVVDDPVTYFRIIGTIGQTFRARPLLVGAEGEIVIDFAELDRFERAGLVEWRRLLKSFTHQVKAVSLVDVDEEVAEVAGSAIAAAANVAVWSVRVFYRCGACGRRSRESYPLGRARWPQPFGELTCRACGGTMRHDTDPARFRSLQDVPTECPRASVRFVTSRDELIARVFDGPAAPDLDDRDRPVVAVAPPGPRVSVRRTALVVALPPIGSRGDEPGLTPSDGRHVVHDVVTLHRGEFLHSEPHRLAVLFDDGLDAAACALEIRALAPGARVALASGTRTPAEIASSAFELLDDRSDRIRIDEETAALVERMFRVESASGAKLALVEYLDDGPTTPPGRAIAVIGHYRLLDILDKGGMGVVHLAEHVTSRRRAVIKLVQEKLLSDEVAARFHREANALASIPRHPSIVEFLEYGQDHLGRDYLVMEYLEGESLSTRLAREKRLAPDLAVELGIQIASALAIAHAVGVVHRDLKPDNIFLVPDREASLGIRAKVLDFGVAKIVGNAEPRLTRTGHAVGTVHYISPEQWHGREDLDHRADIYSLGCVLFEIVTGKPPFDGEFFQLFTAHTEHAPPRPTSLNPELPVQLEDIILRMLAKGPNDRPANMVAVSVELARMAETRP